VSEHDHDRWFYFRAKIDIATQDPALTKRLKANLGGKFTDEPLGRELFDSIRKGKTEVDSVSELEDHGHSS
jgi:hypothetical protein